MSPIDPQSLRPSDLTHIAGWRALLLQLGAKPEHIARWLRTWLQAKPELTDGDLQLPKPMRQALDDLQKTMASIARIHSAHADPIDPVGPAGLGDPTHPSSERLLVALHDGASVESVLLPKGGLCVSTQVGCAVGCVFCKTGEGGLLRQLGSVEILAQVALARRRRAVNKVVFMGMGEPAHNLDAVMQAIDALGQEGAVGHKNLVISSVGDPRLFDQLDARAGLLGQAHAHVVKPALALSLHSADDGQRSQLLPRASQLGVKTLVERSDAYAKRVGYPVQYQWTLMEGVNDSDASIDAAAQLLQGRFGILNLIAYNAIEEGPVNQHKMRRPSLERLDAVVRRLKARGVLASVRHSAAQQVQGGCGQLRARLGKRVVAIRSLSSAPSAPAQPAPTQGPTPAA
jgi:23S rRNA (adenine2503-C2)-methyltransferase